MNRKLKILGKIYILQSLKDVTGLERVQGTFLIFYSFVYNFFREPRHFTEKI